FGESRLAAGQPRLGVAVRVAERLVIERVVERFHAVAELTELDAVLSRVVFVSHASDLHGARSAQFCLLKPLAPFVGICNSPRRRGPTPTGSRRISPFSPSAAPNSTARTPRSAPTD